MSASACRSRRRAAHGSGMPAGGHVVVLPLPTAHSARSLQLVAQKPAHPTHGHKPTPNWQIDSDLASVSPPTQAPTHVAAASRRRAPFVSISRWSLRSLILILLFYLFHLLRTCSISSRSIIRVVPFDSRIDPVSSLPSRLMYVCTCHVLALSFFSPGGHHHVLRL